MPRVAHVGASIVVLNQSNILFSKSKCMISSNCRLVPSWHSIKTNSSSSIIIHTTKPSSQCKTIHYIGQEH